MTQLRPVRIPRFHSGSLPDPITLPDSLIVAEGFDGSHTLMKSDGETWQAIGSFLGTVATLAQALAGTDNSTVISPLRLNQVLVALGLTNGFGDNGYVQAGYVTIGYVSP